MEHDTVTPPFATSVDLPREQDANVDLHRAVPSTKGRHLAFAHIVRKRQEIIKHDVVISNYPGQDSDNTNLRMQYGTCTDV
ncbi:hypothetical protein ANTRET_LOCUS3342 [Anthophora retusa]